MNIFKKNHTSKKETNFSSVKAINYEVISEEQIEFANRAIEIFNPVFKNYGFKLFHFNVTTYGSKIIWIKNNCYIELSSNTHPHDVPNNYGILLGEFKGDFFQYDDEDCVGLWLLKAIQDNLEKVADTPFPIGEEIDLSLNQTKDELLKYGKSFLNGDLTDFYYARKKQSMK